MVRAQGFAEKTPTSFQLVKKANAGATNTKAARPKDGPRGEIPATNAKNQL
jgi:hypothetical protein